MESKYDEIVEFSEIGDFIDVPLKNYSTGMMMRLGFSIATVVQPEILILDEVLAVGDVKFQEKSENRLKSFLEKDVTVLLVSHATKKIRDLCNKAIWLEKGKLIMQGTADEVCDAYEKSTKSDNKIGKKDFNKPGITNSQDLRVEKGEILGLLGVNGTDKINSENSDKWISKI